MPPSYSRLDRIDELVRQQVGEILTTRLRDPRIGFVTVTEARTSPDLRHSRIFVSVLGDDEDKERCLEGLKSAASYIRSELGRRVTLRNTPELTFTLDNTAEQAQRLEQVFQSLDLSLDDDDLSS